MRLGVETGGFPDCDMIGDCTSLLGSGAGTTEEVKKVGSGVDATNVGLGSSRDDGIGDSPSVSGPFVGIVFAEGGRTSEDSVPKDGVSDALPEPNMTSEEMPIREVIDVGSVLEPLTQTNPPLGVKTADEVGVKDTKVVGSTTTEGDVMLEFSVLKTGTTVTIELDTPPKLVVAAVQSERGVLTPHRHSSTTEHPHSCNEPSPQTGALGEDVHPAANGSAGQSQGS